MKRTQTCSLFEPNHQCKKIDELSCSCTLQQENEESFVIGDTLTSSVIVSDECETDSLSSSSLVSSTGSFMGSDEAPRNHVSFNEAVTVRVVYCNSDDEDEDDDEQQHQEENVDSVIELKEEDNSTPFIEPVKFDAEEEAIRSQLVGCICATRRKKHDFAAMYGCGKSISNDDDDDDDGDSYEDEEVVNDADDDAECHEPVRVIVACAPSSSWFSFSN